MFKPSILLFVGVLSISEALKCCQYSKNGCPDKENFDDREENICPPKQMKTFNSATISGISGTMVRDALVAMVPMILGRIILAWNKISLLLTRQNDLVSTI